MKTSVQEVVNDAIEALTYDRNLDFHEWYPAWMTDENGELLEDPKRLKTLKEIFERVQKQLGIN